ncbi:hypothetical protein [Vibrio scophthalmi]|uniref:Uncharacterized protein n=1 Tax=Vibrio scophthalmi TaxID=45658 RepID=A0A1E3WL38_9VIBR|nr:hypothetical protein [Vibrio scophthalmi]ODS10486.1 hypothetical protein VSF3289_00741 [Vibrio scophthalmi]
MKKTLIAATLLSSLVMAGCSSSGSTNGSGTDTELTPDRLPPVWNEPVVPDHPDTPIEGVDPDFGIPMEPVQPPMADEPDPDFGLIDPDFGLPVAPVQPPVNDDNMTPDRLPPTWGGVDNNVDPDFGKPTDQTPDRPSPDFGEDMPTWGGECGSPDGGANCGALPPKPGVGVPDRPIPEADRIDRQSIRDSIRSRLKK